MEALYVDSLSYSLGGNKTHLSESADADRLISRAEDLEYAGFGWHHICEKGVSAYDLAYDAVAPLKSRGDLDEVNAIIYATCLPVNANIGDHSRWLGSRDVKHLMDFPASRLQSDFSLDEAVVFGLGQQACTSMLGSIRLATALLASEPDWQKVLCVSSDRFPDGARYEQAYNLISDGAAACTVGRAAAGFRYLTAHQITNGGLAQATDDETVGSYFAYTRRLVLETLERVAMVPADLDWIVTQNTNERAWRVLARLLQVPAEVVWGPSIGDVGHVISADNVINLRELIDSGKIRPGHRIALVMAGFGMNWQCVVMEAI